jgi:hypothetical protein
VTPLHITQQKNIVQDAFTQEFGTISLESQKRKVKIFPWRGEPGLTAEEIDQQISNRKSALEGFDNSTWEAVYSRYQGIENVSLPVYSNSIISVLRKKSEKSEVVEAPLSFLERFKRGVCQVVQLNRLKKRVKAAREEKLHPKPPQQTSRLIKTGFRLSEAPGDAFQQLLADLSPESCANEASTIESDSCNRLISVNVVVGPIEITDDLLPLNTIPCDFLSIHQYCEYMEFNPREIFLAAGPPHTSRTGFTVEGLGIPEFAAAEPAGNDRRGSVFTTNLGIRPAPI